MWIDRSARSHGPRAHVWNKNKLSWGVWGNVSEWSRLQIVVRQRHIVIATLRYWSSFSSSFFFFLIAICDAKVAMATVCLTGETMKKAIRSAPNQTKNYPGTPPEERVFIWLVWGIWSKHIWRGNFSKHPVMLNPPFWLRTCAFHISLSSFYKNLFHLIGKSCRKLDLDILKSVDFMEISNQRRYIRA